MNTNIENCNEELLKKQKEQLTNEIVYGKHSDHFAVFDIEAGCRKTRSAEKALIKCWEENGEKTIFVRLSDEDCRESMKIINSIANKNIAFAYNNEDVPRTEMIKVNKELPNIPIIIITHQKYKVLMKDSNKRKNFSEGRRTLFIDEFISTIDKIVFGESDIETYRVLFKNDAVLKNAFEKTMHEPIDFLAVWNKEDSSRRFARMTDIHPMKNFNNLLKLIRANVTNEVLLEWRNKILLDFVEYPLVNKNLLSSFDTVKMLCNQILDYKQFFNELILYSDQKLYTTDKQCKYWYLDNNILLDASGELQSAYALNPDVFVLQRCEKVLDHSKWKIINIPVNTTSSGKEKILNFYDVVNDDIKKYGDDILVIGKKNEMDLIKVPNKNKGYFGNVTGSNKWYNKRNVAIIQTHNLTDVDYILKYLHYGKGAFEDKLNLGTTSSGRKSKRIYSFNDKRLEEIRTKWIASEIYQAIKRVNRNMQYDSEVLIYINNEKVIELLKSQMRNCKVSVVEYDDTFTYAKSKQEDYIEELKKDSYATRFIDFLAEVQNGLHGEMIDSKRRIPKIKAREYLGIKTSTNFSSKVLYKSEVILYCKARYIDLSGHYIKLPKVS